MTLWTYRIPNIEGKQQEYGEKLNNCWQLPLIYKDWQMNRRQKTMQNVNVKLRADQSVKKVDNSEDWKLRLARIGRTCTNTQEKADQNPDEFVKKLYDMGHTSVFEHDTVLLSEGQYLDLIIKLEYTELQFLLRARMISEYAFEEYPARASWFILAKYPYEEFEKLNHNASNLHTFEIETCRATSHQFVRHRNLSFTERSLRYFNPAKSEFEFQLPWLTKKTINAEDYVAFHDLCKASAETYCKLHENNNSDTARKVLPLAFSTKLVVSASFYWWEDFLRKRYDAAASIEMIDICQKLCKADEWLARAAEKMDQDQIKKAGEKLEKFLS
jgi:thymidylate synthase ThyX